MVLIPYYKQLCELIMLQLSPESQELREQTFAQLDCDNVIDPGEVLRPAVLVKTRATFVWHGELSLAGL